MFSRHGFGLGLSLVGWVTFGLLYCGLGMGCLYCGLGMGCLKKRFYLFFKSKNMLIGLPLFSHRQCLRNSNTYIVILPLLPAHTDQEILLFICQLIDKLSWSLGGDHGGVDSTISDILNKVIVGVNKGSKATCN